MKRPKHAGGNWSIGKSYGAIVTDEPYEGGVRGYDDTEAYGGYMIAESVAECNRPLLAAAPDMYRALVFCRSVIKEQGMFDMSERMAFDEATKALAKARGDAS